MTASGNPPNLPNLSERTLQRHMKEWGFMKGSHLELLPGSIPWQSPILADLIATKYWQSKTDSQIWNELQKEGYANITYALGRGRLLIG